MRVFVNDRAVDLAPGMTVRHALLAALGREPISTVGVYDAWGQLLGLDGAVREGDRLRVVEPEATVQGEGL